MKKFFKKVWKVLTYFTKSNRRERARRALLKQQAQEREQFYCAMRGMVNNLMQKYEQSRPGPAPANTVIFSAPEGRPSSILDARKVREESKVDYKLPNGNIAAPRLSQHNDKFKKRASERPDWVDPRGNENGNT